MLSRLQRESALRKNWCLLVIKSTIKATCSWVEDLQEHTFFYCVTYFNVTLLHYKHNLQLRFSLFFVCLIQLVNHFRFRRLIIPVTLSPVFPRHVLKLAVPPPLRGRVTLGLRAPTAPTYQQPEGQAAAWPWLRPWDLLPESARAPQQNRHCWSFPRLWCRAAPKMFCTSFQWHVQSPLCTAAVLYKTTHFGWNSRSSYWWIPKITIPHECQGCKRLYCIKSSFPGT